MGNGKNRSGPAPSRVDRRGAAARVGCRAIPGHAAGVSLVGDDGREREGIENRPARKTAATGRIAPESMWCGGAAAPTPLEVTDALILRTPARIGKHLSRVADEGRIRV